MTTLSREQLTGLIDGATRSIFRLQTLPVYNVDFEADVFAAFCAGAKCPHDVTFPYFQKLKSRVLGGVQWENIHILPPDLTPYLRFIVDWAYKFYDDVGVTTSFVFESDIPVAARSLSSDFWIFDNLTVVNMDYDSQGKVLSRRPSSAQTDLTLANEVASQMRGKSFSFTKLESLRRTGIYR